MFLHNYSKLTTAKTCVHWLNNTLDVHVMNKVSRRKPREVGFMRRTGEESAESSRIVLGLLDAVEQDHAHPERLRPSEPGIALGRVTPSPNRCVKRGLVKFPRAPSRRY